MRVYARVSPALLKWGRESAGFSIEEAAQKIKVKPEKLLSWERGEASPTINQLKKLASVYRRPKNVFYLKAPPPDPAFPKDFRRLPIGAKRKTSELIFAVREAHQYRRNVLELKEFLEEPIPEFNLSLDLTSMASSVELIRKVLNLTEEGLTPFSSSAEAFYSLRERLENKGILCLQISKIPIENMRGMAINERPLPVIVVNTKDSYEARIFTLIHELVHLGLKESSLCNLVEEDERIERFCNRIAAEVLVDENKLKEKISGIRFSDLDRLTKRLKKEFKVSQEVILRRLLSLKIITWKEFENIIEILKSREKGSAGGFASYHERIINKLGTNYISLVFRGFYQNKLTIHDILKYINIKIKHLPKIEKEIFGHNTITISP